MDGWVLEALQLSRAPKPVSESAVFVPRKPRIIQDDASVGQPGADHLYAALRIGENVMKIGVSNDVLERLRGLARSFDGQYELLAVWPREAVLENMVVELLKHSKAVVGTSREHANVSLQQLCDIVKAARDLYRTKLDLDAPSWRGDRELEEDSADRALKRKREDVEIERTRAETERARTETERARTETELLHGLVRDGDSEAKIVFLGRLRA